MPNPHITQVTRADVFATLSRIDSTMGADEANQVRAYIVWLEAQVEYYRERALSHAEPLTFYGVQPKPAPFVFVDDGGGADDGLALAEDTAP